LSTKPARRRDPGPGGESVDSRRVVRLALRVIAESSDGAARADLILREALREARPGPVVGEAVARAVFAWFRWRQFADAGSPRADARSLRAALDLEERYAADPDSFDDEALCRRAVPAWLAREMEVTPDFIRAIQREPVLWLRARPGTARKLAGVLEDCTVGAVPGVPDAVRYDGGRDLFRTEAFAGGRFEIQDIASQAVGLVCAPLPGETWWDACAGEGGKTLHLSNLMQNRGLVVASDRSRARLATLRKRAARAQCFNYRVEPWDGGERPPSRARYDGVLVDAPCSGVGTWGRNPHARWTTTPEDVRELGVVQRRLLATAAGSVKPGGRLVYSVCTLTRAETADIAAWFVAGHPEFRPLGFADPFAAPASTRPAEAWLPQVTGGNGMFVAAWARSGLKD
jgi:16S rRNA (cytosine967-C5)-methyltransferase